MLEACPICGGQAASLGASTAAHPLKKCSACGHRWAQEGTFDFESAYGADYSGHRDDAAFESRLASFLREHVRPRVTSGTLLDVGCGGGTFLRVASSLGYDVLGFDLSAAAVEVCRKQGFEAIAGDFVTHDFGERRFSLVAFWDVLEHLTAPAAFVERAHALLEPGGWLLAKVPLHGELSVQACGLVPRLAAPVLGVPFHLQYFTQPSLDRLLGPRFDEKRWVPIGAMRDPARGGSLKRRLARRVVQSIQRASGDGNLVVLARKPLSSSAS